MNAAVETIRERVDAYIDNQSQLDLLRFITCGSVDDGKSTLIGRMLYEAQMIFEDQVASLKADSKRHGTQAGEIDFAFCDSRTPYCFVESSRLKRPALYELPSFVVRSRVVRRAIEIFVGVDPGFQ